MLGDALEFPQHSDSWLQTVLIGGILSMLGFLVVPALIVQGYNVRVLRHAATGDDRSPVFTDWGTLLVDGVKLVAINVVYGLAFLIPMFVLVTVVGVAFSGGGSRLLASVLGVVGLLVGVVLALAVGYVVPAASANFAVEGRFAAAFDLSTVAEAAFTGDYAVAWILALVVAVIGGLIGSALSVIIVGVFVLFYVQVVAFYLFGRGFGLGAAHTA